MTNHIEPFAVDVAEAAKLAGISRATLYREMSAGRIEAKKAGKRRLVIVQSVRDWLSNLPVAA